MLWQWTWKRLTTRLGRAYWAHIASARRTSGSGSTSWVSPQRGDGDRGGQAKRYLEKAHAVRLNDQSLLAAWPTAGSRDWKDTPGVAETGPNRSEERRVGKEGRYRGSPYH